MCNALRELVISRQSANSQKPQVVSGRDSIDKLVKYKELLEVGVIT